MQIDRRAAYRSILASGVLAMLACTAQAAPRAPASMPAGTPTVGPSDSPDARGHAVLKAQLAALDDNDTFVATFGPTATVLTPEGVTEVHESDAAAGAAIAGLHPHAEITSATFDHFASGSAGKVAWFAADLHIAVTSRESDTPPSVEQRTVRAIELLDGAVGWKVTVAAFTRVGTMHKLGTTFVREATDAGPLTSLLTTPAAIGGALGEGAVVYGTDLDERGLGTKDARALLARWKGLTVTLDDPPKIREVRGSTYGSAMGYVHVVTKPGGPAYRLSAFLLALPTSGGKWSVIGASYGAL